jgi:hypothetical protein
MRQVDEVTLIAQRLEELHRPVYHCRPLGGGEKRPIFLLNFGRRRLIEGVLYPQGDQ